MYMELTVHVICDRLQIEASTVSLFTVTVALYKTYAYIVTSSIVY